MLRRQILLQDKRHLDRQAASAIPPDDRSLEGEAPGDIDDQTEEEAAEIEAPVDAAREGSATVS